MEYVLDASLALSWGLPCEETAAGERFLSAAPSPVHFHVPALWWYEIANALLTAVRGRRLARRAATELMEMYVRLAPETDPAPDGILAGRIFHLGCDAAVTAYDAAYLELALRRRLPLATLDSRLAKAAGMVGVKVKSGR